MSQITMTGSIVIETTKMMGTIVIGTTTYFLIFASLIALLLLFIDHNKNKNKNLTNSLIIDSNNNVDDDDDDVVMKNEMLPEPPGPKPWPIIGSLDILGRYDVPYKAFGELAKEYNCQIIKLKLGSVPCVVVNGLDNIKEILITKGPHFDSRPNFVRYNLLFSGDKENSLAFSDWSEMQKTRRETLRIHAFPRAFTKKYHQLNGIITNEIDTLLNYIDIKNTHSITTKTMILQTCANIFTNYFTSKTFEFHDKEFQKIVINFDKIFWEVNQGYAADFMPFLMPLHKLNMKRMANWTHEIREFVENNIINTRKNNWTDVIDENDYVDCLINHVNTNTQPIMSWDTALFSLEDILGGHAAVGNFLMKIFGYLATRKNVQIKAQIEIDAVDISGRNVGLENRKSMPYTEAILLETIRIIASPIVPHVASRDSSVAGYKIEKDTFIFLNNYELNMSEDLWKSPGEFIPDRFVVNGKILKPEFFIPFGGGRRSCMGYKLVQYLSFSILASVLKNYTIMPIKGQSYNVPIGNLALPQTTFDFEFIKR